MSENFESQSEEPQEEKSSREVAWEKMLEETRKKLNKIIERTDEIVELRKTNPEEAEKKHKEYEEEKAREEEEYLKKRIIKRSETKNEKINKWREKMEAGGDDPNSREVIFEFGGLIVGELNRLFGQKYGLSVPAEKVPPVILYDTDVPCYVEPKDDEGKKHPMIVVGTANHFLNGNHICEELAHFYRFQFQPNQEQEILTHEFFGFLGRRMFKKAVLEGAHYFDELDNEEGLEIDAKKDVVLIIKKLKEKIRHLEKAVKEAGSEAEKMVYQFDLDRCAEIRKDITQHQRGYENAFRFDMDKITDWKKLFSLPNEEVRRRFFTDKPDYSGL